MKTKVTIGLCVRNAATMVGEALASTIEQDFPHESMEVIVVDGDSRDNTTEIIKEQISKTDIQYRILSDDRGLGAARQIVVDNATGDYIVWVDADMTLTKDFVRKQVEFMERTPKAGIAKGKYGVYNRASLVATLENMEFVVDSSKYAGEITSYTPLGTSGCIYRVDAIRQARGFDDKAKGVGEDMDAEFRVKTAGWSLYINDSAMFYETRRGSWKSLWNEYFWHGSGAQYLYHKNWRILKTSKMFPPIAILTEFARSVFAYKLTSQKTVFLLPLHWIFKRTAWLLGFIRETTQFHQEAH